MPKILPKANLVDRELTFKINVYVENIYNISLFSLATKKQMYKF